MPADRVNPGRYVYRAFTVPAGQAVGAVIARANPLRVALAFRTDLATEQIAPSGVADVLFHWMTPGDNRSVDFLYQFWGDLVFAEWVSVTGTATNIYVMELLENVGS